MAQAAQETAAAVELLAKAERAAEAVAAQVIHHSLCAPLSSVLRRISARKLEL